MQLSLLQSAQPTYYLVQQIQVCSNASANKEDKFPNSSLGTQKSTITYKVPGSNPTTEKQGTNFLPRNTCAGSLLS